MANKATTDAIQQDWKEREMIEVVHLNILKVRQRLQHSNSKYNIVHLPQYCGTKMSSFTCFHDCRVQRVLHSPASLPTTPESKSALIPSVVVVSGGFHMNICMETPCSSSCASVRKHRSGPLVNVGSRLMFGRHYSTTAVQHRQGTC